MRKELFAVFVIVSEMAMLVFYFYPLKLQDLEDRTARYEVEIAKDTLLNTEQLVNENIPCGCCGGRSHELPVSLKVDSISGGGPAQIMNVTRTTEGYVYTLDMWDYNFDFSAGGPCPEGKNCDFYSNPDTKTFDVLVNADTKIYYCFLDPTEMVPGSVQDENFTSPDALFPTEKFLANNHKNGVYSFDLNKGIVTGIYEECLP